MQTKELKAVCDNAGNGLLPVLGYVHIYGGRAQVGNGRFSVDVPCDLPACTVSAERIVAAWGACSTEPVVTLTDNHMVMKSGRIKARLERFEDASYPRTNPDPKTAHTVPGLAVALSTLQPFVATDASRPWATSICLKGHYAYATNNIVLCRMPFPTEMPAPVNLPGIVIDAIVARGEPVDIGVSENSLTFYFEDSSWIKTNLIDGDWPTGVVDKLIDGLDESAWEAPHPELGKVMATAAKLADARHPVIEFSGTMLSLVAGVFEADELDPLPDTGKINARIGALVFGHADAVQWHQPKENAHSFKAGPITGVFGGQK